jgi:O-antigen/teichoic acid export membrane protein
LKQLVKSASLIGFTEVAMVVVSIVRNKYLAVTIGPEGFGVYSLLSSFFGFMSIFAGVWLATPTMKYISEYNSNNDKDSVQKVFDFSFVIVFFVATLITILFFVFAKVIKNAFLSPEVIFLHYALFAASYISTSLTSVFRSLFQAFKLIKKVVIIRIISNIFNLITVVILVYFFDLSGFFINILVSSLFLLFLFWRDGKNIVKVRIVKLNFKEQISKKILSFGSVNIFLGFINLFSEYLRRIVIIRYTNMSVLGLFQASFGLTKYLGVISDGANFYYVPKMSENMSMGERNKALNDYLRIILLSGSLFSVVAILFGRMAINILYAKSFLPLADVFYIFVIAQFLVSIQLGFQGIIVGMAKLRIHSVVTTITHILIVVIPLLLLKKYGLWAVGFGAVVASAQHILINFTYLRKRIGIKIRLDNIILILMAVLFIGMSVVMEDVLIYYKFVIIVILSLLLLMNLKKEEKVFMVNYLKKRVYLVKKNI